MPLKLGKIRCYRNFYFRLLFCVILSAIQMSILLEKSKQNARCADLLMSKEFYNAAVSRAYYSILQYIMYILRTKYNIPETELLPDYNNSTHIRAQTLIGPYIEAADQEAYKFFQDAFLGLKKARVKADYKEVNFDPAATNQVISTSLRIKNTLEDIFKK